MKRKRFSLEQIAGVLKQAEVGMPVVEVIRKAGISEQTLYRWMLKYVGLEVRQVRQMKLLRKEKRAVAATDGRVDAGQRVVARTDSGPSGTQIGAS